jgi:hypothetical protein
MNPFDYKNEIFFGKIPEICLQILYETVCWCLRACARVPIINMAIVWDIKIITDTFNV